jgi:hypothetical protein
MRNGNNIMSYSWAILAPMQHRACFYFMLIQSLDVCKLLIALMTVWTENRTESKKFDRVWRVVIVGVFIEGASWPHDSVLFRGINGYVVVNIRYCGINWLAGWHWRTTNWWWNIWWCLLLSVWLIISRLLVCRIWWWWPLQIFTSKI